MKNRTLAVLIAVVLLSSPMAMAQTDGVTLDHVDPLYATDTLECGVPIEIFLRITNPTGGLIDTTVDGSTNGFRLYSPDGATWQPDFTVDTILENCFPAPCDTILDTIFYGRFIDPQGASAGLVWQGDDPQIYDGGLFVNSFSEDGAGADTVAFSGFTQETGTGIFETFDEISFGITIDQIDCSSNGLMLCLDSSWFRPTGEWLWAFGPLDDQKNLPPNWGGEKCWTIFNPSGGVGEFTTSGLTNDSLYFPNVNDGTTADRTFDLGSDGDPINFSITIRNSSAWLSVEPLTGTTPATITVGVDPEAVDGQVADTIDITGSAKAAPIEIPVFFDETSDVQEIEGNVPESYALNQNYPNPFNPSTVIRFALPEAVDVTLDIYNVLGQKVKTLVDEPLSASEYEVEWDGTNDAGLSVASGVYFYKLQTNTYVETKKMILSR